MINKQTTLDLNGPQISFTTQPSSVTINSGGSTSFTGIATATFPSQTPTNPATNTGSISYRWYADGYGALSDGIISSLGVTVTGTDTTTLSISDASTTATAKVFYLVADYTPSAYSQPEGSAVVVGTARSTGNAFNDPKSSNNATLTVNPTLSITSNPSGQEVAEGEFATFTANASASDGSSISVRWQLNGSDLSDNGSTIFGSATNTLRISLANASTNTIRAKFTHPTASNSPIYSSSATFTVVLARAILNYEVFRDDVSYLLGSGSIDLTQQPGDSYTFVSGVGIGFQTTCIYAPEKDINVEIELAGAKGGDYGTTPGGRGGMTKIRYTLQRNTEYVLKIGHMRGFNIYPAGGRWFAGGMTILYKGSRVVAVAGGGGQAAQGGRGGNGGGAGQAGRNGGGREGGRGGRSVSTGGLPSSGGSFGDRTIGTGGNLTTCGIGRYWAEQGYSPCSDMGFVFLRDYVGNILNGSTDTINRGFKPGRGFRNNGGEAVGGADGGGGGGAYGGDAGTNQCGGGGGSGYWSGEGTLLSSLTGANNSAQGYIKITVV